MARSLEYSVGVAVGLEIYRRY